MPFTIEVKNPSAGYLALSEKQKRKTKETRLSPDENVLEINRRLAALGVSVFLHQIDEILREFGYSINEEEIGRIFIGNNEIKTLKIRDLADTAAKGHLFFSELLVKNF